jgi:surfactin synthase thioesterase subunit
VTGRWFLREPGPDAVARLFCLPYSGCGASMYRNWPADLAGMEVCAVQLPGRENRLRERPHATYQELAADLADALTPYLDRPFGFFGHCGSALSAYETAAEVERRGLSPATAVFVSSQVAPQDGPFGTYLTMGDAELSEEIRRLIRVMGGNPLPALVELCLEVMREDVAANARYVVPEPYRLTAPLVAIGWDRDTNVPAELMSGWPACSRAPAQVLLSGEHFAFLNAPADLRHTLAEQMGVLAPDRG